MLQAYLEEIRKTELLSPEKEKEPQHVGADHHAEREFIAVVFVGQNDHENDGTDSDRDEIFPVRLCDIVRGNEKMKNKIYDKNEKPIYDQGQPSVGVKSFILYYIIRN